MVEAKRQGRSRWLAAALAVVIHAAPLSALASGSAATRPTIDPTIRGGRSAAPAGGKIGGDPSLKQPGGATPAGGKVGTEPSVRTPGGAVPSGGKVGIDPTVKRPAGAVR